MRLPLEIAAMPFMALANMLDKRPTAKSDPGRTVKERYGNQQAAKMRAEERQARRAARRQREVEAGGWR